MKYEPIYLPNIKAFDASDRRPYCECSDSLCDFVEYHIKRSLMISPIGSILVQFEVTLAREVWSIDQAVLNGYVDLRRQNDTIELVTLKPLDLEEMNNAVRTVELNSNK